MVQNLTARRRECNPLIRALKQSHSQFLFELLDLAAQRWLAHMACLCRTAKVPLLRNRHEISQFLKIQPDPANERLESARFLFSS